MPEDKFPDRRFATSEELVQYLKSRSDDIETVAVSVAKGVLLTRPNGDQKFIHGAGGVIGMVGGDYLALHPDDLQNAINDGVFTQLRIPIRLVPLLADRDDQAEEGY